MFYKLFNKNAFKPERAHFDDAGIDFRTPVDITINPGESALVNLLVGVQIPIGYFGKMESKSGLMTKHGVVCAGGVIDSGFRGSIKIRMENHGTESYHFSRGDKIVQMVLIPVLLSDLKEVESLEDAVSGRNADGWGSTGK